MDLFIAVVENTHRQFSKQKLCPQTRKMSIQDTMFQVMIPHLKAYPIDTERGYHILKLFFQIAKTQKVVERWSSLEWKYWKRILTYLARHLPPKQGVALAA
jgi:hypothetical protein